GRTKELSKDEEPIVDIGAQLVGRQFAGPRAHHAHEPRLSKFLRDSFAAAAGCEASPDGGIDQLVDEMDRPITHQHVHTVAMFTASGPPPEPGVLQRWVRV